MENGKNYDVPIHYAMALCGGMIGVYAIVDRMGVFGSAQTANMIELMCDVLGRDPLEISYRVMALVIYVGAMATTVVLEKRTNWNLKYTAILVDLAAVTAVGCFPETMNPFVALYPIFFAMAFQWCVFKGANGYVSATIFSTNNLKQTVTAFTDYLLTGRDEAGRAEKGQKAAFFGGTLLSFHAGVAAGYGCWLMWSVHSIWVCVLPLAVGAVLVTAAERQLVAVQADTAVCGLEGCVK